MKQVNSLSLILFLLSSISGQEIKSSSYSIFIDYGQGYYSGDIVNDERNFLKDNNIQLILDNSFTTELKYEYRIKNYRSFLNYHLKKHISLGLQFQSLNTYQRSLLTEEAFDIKEYSLYKLKSIGPILSYWKKINIITLSLHTSILYSYGDLHRIPIVYKHRSIFNQDIQSFIVDYNKEIDLNGVTIDLEFAINYIFKFGLISRMSIKYSYSNLKLDNDPYVRRKNENSHNFLLNIGIGFTTRT